MSDGNKGEMGRRDFMRVTAIGAMAAGLPAAAETRNGMPYRPLGRTGESVSLLCLGGSHVGGNDLSDAEAVRIMRHAVDEGVNFFDNAWHYHSGRSEERMGLAMKDGYRDKVFLMTKHHGRDRKVAEEHLHESLRRLQTDVIDLWQFHEVIQPDEPARIYAEGAIEFAQEAQKAGKIRYIGFTGHHYPSIHREMIERGFAWDTVQMPLNVFDHHFRSFEAEVLPLAVERNMGVIAMKTQGGSPGNIPRTGAATPEECLRYAMSLPVAAVCSGMDSMAVLEANLATAKAFAPIAEAERAALLERTRTAAADGAHEPYKTRWHRG